MLIPESEYVRFKVHYKLVHNLIQVLENTIGDIDKKIYLLTEDYTEHRGIPSMFRDRLHQEMKEEILAGINKEKDTKEFIERFHRTLSRSLEKHYNKHPEYKEGLQDA